MTKWVGQWLCIKLCVKLKHSYVKTIWMIDGQLVIGSFITIMHLLMHHFSCRVFSPRVSNHPGDSAPYSPDLVPCDFWLSPKLKSPLQGMSFQTIGEIQENTTGQLMAIGGTVWGPKVPILKGTEVSLSYVQCFLYPVSSSINVSVLHIAWLDTFWTDLLWFQILHCNWPLRNYNLSSTDIASKIISKIIWKTIRRLCEDWFFFL